MIGSHASIAERNAQLGEREQRAERDGAALHVRVHVEHAEERLQIRAAGVEQDALADERHGRCRAAAGPVAQVQDAGVARRVAAGDGKECARAELLELALVEESCADAVRFRERLDRPR